MKTCLAPLFTASIRVIEYRQSYAKSEHIPKVSLVETNAFPTPTCIPLQHWSAQFLTPQYRCLSQ